MKAEPGSSLALLAKHDTYSIKFAWQSPPSTDSNTSHVPNADREMDNVHECLPAHVSTRGCDAAVPLKVSSALHESSLLDCKKAKRQTIFQILTVYPLELKR